MIELLEPRVAPAALTGNVLTYTDIDGDLVKITFSHATMAASDFVFSNGSVDGTTSTPQFLTSLSMSGHEGGGFTLTAKQHNGEGDGRANIGTITSTTNLGSIRIDGDLSLGTFSSNSALLPSVKSLTVLSLGGDVTTSGAKVEFGGIGSLTVKTDVRNVEVLLDASPVVTRSITIGGDLIGGSFSHSGNITSNATLTSLKIGGSVIGGDSADTGEVDIVTSGLRSLTIGGSIIGGAAGTNGRVSAGPGDPAETIIVGGDIVGGNGNGSGVLVFGIAKSLNIAGSVVGSETSGSGGVIGTKSLGSLALGSIVGGNSPTNGSVDFSGYVQLAGNMSSIKIRGGIYAGQASGSGSVAHDGALTVDGTVGTATIGTIQGNANHAALFSVSGISGSNAAAVKTLTVVHSVSFGSILAGYGRQTGNASPVAVDAGFGSIAIGGNLVASYITAGTDAGADGVPGNADDLYNSSGTATIGSVKVAGQFYGQAGSSGLYRIIAEVIDKVQVGSAIYGHGALDQPQGVSFSAIGVADAICKS